jgi:hypothetical protein
MSTRTTAEVFESHLQLRKAGDFEADLRTNYAEDIVMLTCTRIFRGHEGLRACYAELQCYFPDAEFEYVRQLVEGDVAFLVWTGRSPAGEVRDGADTFLIRDGRIAVQTIHYSVDRDKAEPQM